MDGRRLQVLLLAVALVAGGCATSDTSTSSASASGSRVPATSPDATAAPSTSGSPSARATATASPTPVRSRSADLDALLDQLRTYHPNPFLDEGETAFVARLETLRASAGSLTDVGFLVEVMRLMGDRPRDGHSGAWAMAQPGTLLRALPIWLWDFPDGIRIVAAQPPLDDLIGARIVRVGHTPIDEARTVIDPLVPRDNASNLRGNLPIYLQLPDVANELGLRDPGGPALTVEGLDGTMHEIDVEPLPMETVRDWVFDAYGGGYPEALPPDADGPLYRRDIKDPFWWTTLDAGGLYVAYNAIAAFNDDDVGITKMAAAIEAEARRRDARLIIDLRNDGGGDNTTYGSVLTAVTAFAAAHPGRVALITGRGTFSAAGNFVTELMVGPQGPAIRLVGEPPGGGLDIYGDVSVLTLPSSGIVVLVSKRYHEKAPGDDRLQIEPDIPVEITWDDYAAGRDPVLQAALAATVDD